MQLLPATPKRDSSILWTVLPGMQRIWLNHQHKETEVWYRISSIPAISILDHTCSSGQLQISGLHVKQLSWMVRINGRIGKAATVMSKLNTRVWTNKNLTLHTKLKVYQACVLSTLLYGSETWTTYTRQEHRLNAAISDASARSWATHGRTRSPTTMFYARLGQHQSMQCSWVNVGYAGLDTSPEWTKDASPRTYCTVSWSVAQDPQVAHSSDSRTRAKGSPVSPHGHQHLGRHSSRSPLLET
ncbi:hypothetical protein BSL78_03571 [Apostichopus japonicus]|uniref:Uncharacterized protein n=1 Tax=Stichopus japonicus TaxID=307972 RepID=A0A2G8LGW9_STIJA|nr:hypothetical protein BSL78_03571 [Apostichopus japonicus]